MDTDTTIKSIFNNHKEFVQLTMAKNQAEVNIDAIIEEVMRENGTSPSDIPEERPFSRRRFISSLRNRKKWSKRYFKGHVNGEFKCGNDACANTWTSPHSWCILDLKEQTILMKFRQKCIKKNHVKISKLFLDNPESLESPGGQEHSAISSSVEDFILDSHESESGDSSSDHEDSGSGGSECEGEYPTYVDDKSIRKMVQWAVNLHLELVSGEKAKKPKQDTPDDHIHTAKHPRHLCEMCKLLRRPCNGPL